MKKSVKSVIAKSLAVVMAFSVAAIAPAASADAAAKKPTLAKKLTVNVGKSKTLKVKGKAKVKKTTWSLNKKGKKIVSISKKKKKSVKIKGKKAGKATLTAKIKVGKKTYKKKCKITVKKVASKNTPTPTPSTGSKSTPTPPGGNNDPTQKPKVDTVDGKKVIESNTYPITINEQNETTLTCISKRPEDADEVAGYTEYGKNGVTFTSLVDYNSGVSFYINPCTSDDQLVDLPKGEGYLGFQDAIKDMSDYDYIRMEVTSENELNFRTYNEYDALESEGFPGTCTTEVYEAKWSGPVPAADYLVKDGGVGKMVKDGYTTRTVFVPIEDLYSGKGSEAGSGCDFSTISAIAVSPQRAGMEVTIHSIDFVKVERPNKVSGITVTCEKDTVANNKTATLVATVNPENASRKIVKWTSSDPTLATVNFQGTVLANNQDKTGECTFTATATDGSGVVGSIKLKIGDDSGEPQIITTQKLDFTDANVTAAEGAVKSADGIKFPAGSNQTFVNFGKYMDAKNIDLSKYDSLKVDWELQDADGKAVEDFSDYPDDSVPTNGKIAFAASNSLNGYSNGVDTNYTGDDDTTKDQMFLSVYTGDTNILTISSLNPTEVPTIAGFNLQLTDAIPANCHIVVKAVTFVKDEA